MYLRIISTLKNPRTTIIDFSAMPPGAINPFVFTLNGQKGAIP